MENDFVGYMILLEETLAEFYRRIKDQERNERIRPLLEFMETHSMGHADMIRDLSESVMRPVIDPNLVKNVQNNITRKVAREVELERDLVKTLTFLGQAEEEVGKLYGDLAQFVGDLAGYYTAIRDLLEKIGKDEYMHRDLLLNDRKRLTGEDGGKK